MSRAQKAAHWLRSAPPGEVRTQQQAAALFGIRQPTISAALKRGPNPVTVEREACAKMAEDSGARHLAHAIRNRGAI